MFYLVLLLLLPCRPVELAWCTRNNQTIMSWFPDLFIVLLHILLFGVSLSVSDDLLAPAKPLIFPDEKLTSNDGVFALGFFSPNNSSSTRFYYLGIWYDNVPEAERRVVWVANRDNPITITGDNRNSTVTLAVTSRAGLVLADSEGRRVYWTTAGEDDDIAAGTGTGVPGEASAALLNEGNLVLRSSNGTVLWQSFHHPTDTILPNMPLRVNHRTRFTDRLVSWKSSEDPSTGEFSVAGDVSSGIQYFIWHGSSVLWRSGAWNGGMVASYQLSGGSSVIMETVIANGDEISMRYGVSDGSPGLHARISSTGRYEFRVWNSSSSVWTLLDATTTPPAGRSATATSRRQSRRAGVPTASSPTGTGPVPRMEDAQGRRR